ncbi:putative L-ribulokinase [Trypanosoma rangeli]|uniref:KIF-binding protein n=1 Tax=Trypanosoma rangeli TaxID=5698 RepID=A0A3R7RTL1_TRYRA|nr:putative L-ribulokinase [Trypanosoma rangeli]RNF12646.1 putative L-ribulokinase [Trypanosoma rangeli]|eukprot:RNF12646.1 putative L-ribulokinase [Trypanosoma rangeli]
MDPNTFSSSFDAIVSLSNTEGPRRNILEPKFAAREQMQAVQESVRNAYKESPSQTAMSQLCRCHVFIGLNMLETDEEAEGVQEICKAYTLTLSGAKRELLDNVVDIAAYPLEEILRNEVPFVTAEKEYAFVTEFMRVHNALGLYLSNRNVELRINDAKQVLLVAERAYKEWKGWFQSLPGSCLMKDVPVLDNGTLDRASIAPDALSMYTARFEMDTAYTSTLFFLAQVYTACQMTVLASRYCHHTLYHQLLNKMEFSKKDWATNALHLSAFYSSYFDYGKALHCLQAGEYIMPKENANEETLGIVAWAFGKFYLHRLNYYANVGQQCAPRGHLPDGFEEWWVDYPLDIPPPQPLPAIETFEEARECFKEANTWFNKALEYYLYDGSCTEHIEIVKDIAQLYAALIPFEANRSRVIAMHQRRVALLEPFPGDLNFNAYPTLVRQLLFDLGAMHEELLEVYMEQKQNPTEGEKPLSDKKLNAVTDKTQSFYTRFCDTWKDPQNGTISETLDADSRLPFFRALMRLAHLQMKRFFRNPKDEYDNISISIGMFKRALAFAASNPMKEEAETEARLAREMVALLPMKQKDLWRVYHNAVE